MTEASKPRCGRARTQNESLFNAAPRGKINPHWRSVFLDMLADTSNVSASAISAGVSTSRAYKSRRNEPEFARLWYAALIEGYEHLEMETLQRLRMGTGKDDPKFDIANALRILALHKDTVKRERARQDAEDEDAVYASIHDRIDLMRQREMEIALMLTDDSEDPADMASGEQ